MVNKKTKVPSFSLGLVVAPWKFDVLKTNIFSLEDSLLGQIFVLETSNYREVTI